MCFAIFAVLLVARSRRCFSLAIQKGSAESKKSKGEEVDEDPEAHRTDPDAPWPVRRGGIWFSIYKKSLFLAFLILFLASMLGHAIGGTAEQSEFLAVGSIVVLTIFLRQQGSEESKPVHAPSRATGSS